MCLIIDSCCFHCVFDLSSKRHAEFSPVLEWITKGDGKLVYGGQKYKRELRRQPKYLRFLASLRVAGHLVEVDDKEVDRLALTIRKKVLEPDFDDEHLVALVIVSGCRVVCTDDKRADKYLRQKALYPKQVKRPSIYRYEEHQSLCCKKYITGKCR